MTVDEQSELKKDLIDARNRQIDIRTDEAPLANEHGLSLRPIEHTTTASCARARAIERTLLSDERRVTRHGTGPSTAPADTIVVRRARVIA